jgi:hypothetical protein
MNDSAAEYETRANRHKPTDAVLATEIRRLVATGLKPRDVAYTLRLNLNAVLQAAVFTHST